MAWPKLAKSLTTNIGQKWIGHTRIPRKDTQEREERKNIVGEREQSAKFWAPQPSGTHPSVPHPSGSPETPPPETPSSPADPRPPRGPPPPFGDLPSPPPETPSPSPGDFPEEGLVWAGGEGSWTFPLFRPFCDLFESKFQLLNSFFDFSDGFFF